MTTPRQKPTQFSYIYRAFKIFISRQKNHGPTEPSFERLKPRIVRTNTKKNPATPNKLEEWTQVHQTLYEKACGKDEEWVTLISLQSKFQFFLEILLISGHCILDDYTGGKL